MNSFRIMIIDLFEKSIKNGIVAWDDYFEKNGLQHIKSFDHIPTTTVIATKENVDVEKPIIVNNSAVDRLEVLQKNVTQQYKLLAEWEQKFDFTLNPTERIVAESEIEKTKVKIELYNEEIKTYL